LVDVADLFAVDLVDAGARVDPRFAGIWTPRLDENGPKVGVTDQFLANADTFHRKYTQLDYYRGLLERAASRAGVPRDVKTVFDIGSGSGNSVIPALEMFPSAHVVATDISENLLRILRDNASASAARGGRLSLVCVDATKPCVKPGRFDVAIGAAILHHLIDPRAAVSAACEALKPGGTAIFFEPFENGNAILRLAYTEILERAGPGCSGRDLPEDVADLLRRLVEDYRVRTGSDKSAPLFREIDDKWLFTRSFFEDAASEFKLAAMVIYPLHDSAAPFTSQTVVNLKLGLGAAKDRMPQWAWDVISKYDTSFSPELKRDLLIEGCVILTK
jgi:SAM-dependent methyltransferase